MLGNLFGPKSNSLSPNQPAQPGSSSQTGVPLSTTQQPISQTTTTSTSISASTNGDAEFLQTENTQTQNAQNTQTQVAGSAIDPSTRQNMSALSHLDSRATQVLSQAQREAQRIQQAFIEPEQVLYGLLFDSEIFQMLNEFSLDVTKLSNALSTSEKQGTFTGMPTLSDATKQLFEQAYTAAKARNVDFLTPEDILVAMFSTNNSASQFLESQGLKKEQLSEKLEKSPEFSTGKKSVLQKFGMDLTEAAKSGTLDPITGRDREVERVVHILLRRTKNNPVIIGEPGTGKTAIVEGLAQKIADGSAPKDLLGKKIIQLDVASMVAGASHRGEFEERLRSVIKEAMASSGVVILFIDEIHTLIGAGDNEGALDASNIIKPYLARGQLQLIGTTTTVEYRKYFEKDKAFERRFQPVLCEEPSEEVAEQMIAILKPKYEKFHNVVINAEAIKAAVHLSKRYIGERYLPDKAVDLLDEAAADVRLMQNQGKRQDNNVTKSDIENVVANWTGIPITKLTENESERLLHLEDLIHKRLIDQENAVKAVAEAVRRGRIGLASANRPIASFMFLGPTGTGKTELAKTLAQILFGRDDAMTRLDMSEYMEKHEVAKLIGAPPGYVGYEEGGQLTEAVRTKPYSVVLLDEVEKAHPDVFNILLQLLEDGRLTDNKGNTISFKNTIVIATSNIGSAQIQEKLLAVPQTPQGEPNPEQKQKTYAQVQEAVTGELHKFFKPELLNRFDEIIIFEPLAQKDMKAVAKLGIEKTQKLIKDQGFDLTISDAALTQLAKEGYDPLYGARPLRRLIQTAIENPIAMLLIQKTFQPGEIIMIDYNPQNEQYVFAKAQQQPGTQDPNARQPGNSAQQSAVSDQTMANGQMQNPTANGQVQSNGFQLPTQNGIVTPPQQNGMNPVQQPPTQPVQAEGGTQMQPQKV